MCFSQHVRLCHLSRQNQDRVGQEIQPAFCEIGGLLLLKSLQYAPLTGLKGWSGLTTTYDVPLRVRQPIKAEVLFVLAEPDVPDGIGPRVAAVLKLIQIEEDDSGDGGEHCGRKYPHRRIAEGKDSASDAVPTGVDHAAVLETPSRAPLGGEGLTMLQLLGQAENEDVSQSSDSDSQTSDSEIASESPPKQQRKEFAVADWYCQPGERISTMNIVKGRHRTDGLIRGAMQDPSVSQDTLDELLADQEEQINAEAKGAARVLATRRPEVATRAQAVGVLAAAIEFQNKHLDTITRNLEALVKYGNLPFSKLPLPFPRDYPPEFKPLLEVERGLPHVVENHEVASPAAKKIGTKSKRATQRKAARGTS